MQQLPAQPQFSLLQAIQALEKSAPAADTGSRDRSRSPAPQGLNLGGLIGGSIAPLQPDLSSLGALPPIPPVAGTVTVESFARDNNLDAESTRVLSMQSA